MIQNKETIEDNAVMCKNNVTLYGVLEKEFTFSHEFKGERFLESSIGVERLSGFKDVINLTISENFLNNLDVSSGSKVKIIGTFRSRNEYSEEDQKTHSILYVFVDQIIEISEEDFEYSNSLELAGYLCKKPNLRETPKGRTLSDLLIAVNRNSGKSDYIPSIIWGRNAKFASGLDIGTMVSCEGSIQSREYMKTKEDGTQYVRVAYEFSIRKIKVLKNVESKDSDQ